MILSAAFILDGSRGMCSAAITALNMAARNGNSVAGLLHNQASRLTKRFMRCCRSGVHRRRAADCR